MAQPYVGEIRMFAGNFAPAGWMFCEGQLLPISENETLFNLIGTTYGGDGQSTFALPDLRGRVPLHMGNSFILAETGGAEEVTLDRVADSGAQSSNAGVERYSHSAKPERKRHAARRQPRSTGSAGPDRVSQSPIRCRRRADRNRTIISSRTCASTSSFRCSAFSRRQLEKERAMDPFVAEIRIFPFNFAPKGWAFCDGQILPLSQNTALFSLLGTTYGGDGKSNFALPNVQGNAPMHPGQGPGLSLHDFGETGGSETVSLLESEIPNHNHGVGAQTVRTERSRISGQCNAQSPGERGICTTTRLVQRSLPMNTNALAPAGGDQPHNNMQPYLTLSFCIALQGVYPPRTERTRIVKTSLRRAQSALESSAIFAQGDSHEERSGTRDRHGRHDVATRTARGRRRRRRIGVLAGFAGARGRELGEEGTVALDRHGLLQYAG